LYWKVGWSTLLLAAFGAVDGGIFFGRWVSARASLDLSGWLTLWLSFCVDAKIGAIKSSTAIM
jgi:hypothetical protein